MVTLENSDNNKYIAIYTFAIKDNKYSNCLESVRYEIKNMITYEAVTRREEYDFDEEVASDLSISISLNQTSFSNDGVMIPYGLTDSEDICDVTIMGEEPTDIIPIDYDGITYYFWYFNSEAIDEQIREELQGNLDYKQVIDSMEIDINGE